MDLTELRKVIDTIDDSIVSLFCQRMEIAAKIAEYKKEHGLPILVPAREQEKLADVAKKAAPGLEEDTRALYVFLMERSRNYQSRCSGQPEVK